MTTWLQVTTATSLCVNTWHTHMHIRTYALFTRWEGYSSTLVVTTAWNDYKHFLVELEQPENSWRELTCNSAWTVWWCYWSSQICSGHCVVALLPGLLPVMNQRGGGRVGSWGRECHRACVGECLCWCELCRCKQMEGESGQVLTVSACVHVHARGMASANTSRQCHSQKKWSSPEK